MGQVLAVAEKIEKKITRLMTAAPCCRVRRPFTLSSPALAKLLRRCAAVEYSLEPDGEDGSARQVDISFRPEQGTGPAGSSVAAPWDDKTLVVQNSGHVAQFGEKAKWFRLGARKSLIEACKNPEIVPGTMARYAGLVINGGEAEEERVLQVALTLSQWGLLQPDRDDISALSAYLKKLCKGSKFYEAIKEAAEEIFGKRNFLLPEAGFHFRAYCKKTILGIYAQHCRDHARNAPYDDELPGTPWRRRRSRFPEDTGVHDLAVRAGTSPRSIYRCIEEGKLQATKRGMSLRIEGAAAAEFVESRTVTNLLKACREAGLSYGALRKRVQRWRKRGIPEAAIAGQLREELDSAYDGDYGEDSDDERRK